MTLSNFERAELRVKARKYADEHGVSYSQAMGQIMGRMANEEDPGPHTPLTDTPPVPDPALEHRLKSVEQYFRVIECRLNVFIKEMKKRLDALEGHHE